MIEYPEIARLRTLQDKYEISIIINEGSQLAGRSSYPFIKLTLGEEVFEFYVDDEYDDFRIKYPLLLLCVVLREFEDYEEASDYLVWCTAKGLSPEHERVRAHHMDMRAIFRNIHSLFGEINSHISDYNFELNSGAAQQLRTILSQSN